MAQSNNILGAQGISLNFCLDLSASLCGVRGLGMLEALGGIGVVCSRLWHGEIKCSGWLVYVSCEL